MLKNGGWQLRLIHEFHNLSWITEINELFHDILIYWDAPVYLESVHSLNSPNCSFRCISAYPFYGQWWFPGLCLGVRYGMGLLWPKLRHSEPHPKAQTSRTLHHYQTVLGLEPKLHRERAPDELQNKTQFSHSHSRTSVEPSLDFFLGLVHLKMFTCRFNCNTSHVVKSHDQKNSQSQLTSAATPNRFVPFMKMCL